MKAALLVESVPLLRRGIKTTLENTGEWTVLESVDRTEIIQLAQAHHPECAILDGSMTSPDPLEICWTLREQVQKIGILILDSKPDEERLFIFLVRGASAYEPHTISTEILIDRAQRLSRGEYLIRNDMLLHPPPKTHQHEEKIVNETKAPPPKGLLSYREIQMLEHIMKGNSNKEIAKSLSISDQTVKNHITSILKKLCVDDRTAAVVHALRHGWIVLERR